MQFGISTHLYHGVRLDRDHLVEIAAHGFEAVEIFATRSHFDYHDGRAVDAIAGHLADAGLRAHAVHAPTTESYRDGVWGPGYSLANGEDVPRRAAVAEAGAAIRAAERLGARLVVLHPGTPTAQEPGPRDNRRDAFLRSVEELQDAAEGTGVHLALEVIPNGIADADALVRLLEDDIDPDGLGVCLDTGHAFMQGDVADAVEAVSGYLVTTHLHDNDGARDSHQAPFDGGIDWTTTMMAFRKVGYDGPWIFEVAGAEPPRLMLERLQRARRRLEGLLA